MAKHNIKVYIEPGRKVAINKGWLKRVIKEILDSVNYTGEAELGLVITGDETIQRLNRIYRGINETTDVLSFSMVSQLEQQGLTFVVPPDGLHRLGEIVISYPQAIRQAEQEGNKIEAELIRLIIHGLLHILGYDHSLLEDEQRMQAAEKQIAEKLCYLCL